MNVTPIKIDIDIELFSEGIFQIIDSSVDFQETKAPSISELILKAISASEKLSN